MSGDPWADLKEYEQQRRQQNTISTNQTREKKEIAYQQLLSEQAHILSNQRVFSENQQVFSENQRFSEERLKIEAEREDIIAKLAEELRRENAQRTEAQERAIKNQQAAQGPLLWASKDGREFRSPREAEFWDAWIEDEERAKKIPLIPQHPIGRFRVDFAHVESKTAIELDGRSYHTDRYRFTQDKIRQRELEKQGWFFIRFSGDEISANVSERVEEAYHIICGR